MFLSKKNRAVIAISIGIICYFITGYFLDRTNYFQLTVQYLILCIIFWYVITTEKNNFTLLLALSILFRLIFLFAIPNLSQDFYRFIWDGRMIFEAINPYESLPETFIKNEAYPINQTIDLYDGMGSLNGSHYTNYPPINQLSFVMAAIFAKTSILWSVVVMRLQIILADIGIIYIGKKILEKLNMPIHHIFLYALNPFIIIELTGNLHFEAVMLFLLVWSLYLLLQKKWIWSAFIFGLSVSVKLIPLLFIPLFYQWFTKDGKSKGVLNFFSFGEDDPIMTIVDMPGYGFAKASKSKIAEWTELSRHYLLNRSNLRRVFLLIDGRHNIKPSDEEIMCMLDNCAVSYQIVLTKIDKIKDRNKKISETENSVKSHVAVHPVVYATSSHKDTGLDDLRNEISSLVE